MDHEFTDTTYQQGREIAALQATVDLQGKTLGQSMDLIRQDLKSMRAEMATKADLVDISPNKECRGEVRGRLSCIEMDLYGKDATGKETGRPGMVTQVSENTKFISDLKAYWIVILVAAGVLAYVFVYVLPVLLKYIHVIGA